MNHCPYCMANLKLDETHKEIISNFAGYSCTIISCPNIPKNEMIWVRSKDLEENKGK